MLPRRSRERIRRWLRGVRRAARDLTWRRPFIDVVRSRVNKSFGPLPPVFVTGCPHSGTSLVTRILSAHSQLSAAPGETWAFTLTSFGAARALIAAAPSRPSQRLLEKTPIHLLYLNRIWDLFPDAQVVIAVRDGRDVACSLRARGVETFASALATWTMYAETAEEHRSHPRVTIVRLEDLVEHPDAEAARLLDSLALPREDVLNYHEETVSWYASERDSTRPDSVSGSDHDAYRNWQINQPVFSTTHRWSEDMGESDEQALERAPRFLGQMREFSYITG